MVSYKLYKVQTNEQYASNYDKRTACDNSIIGGIAIQLNTNMYYNFHLC